MCKEAIVVNVRDNVATAVADVEPGEEVRAMLNGLGVTVRSREPVPFGHKIALRELRPGDLVYKYGEVIGEAVAPIPVGAHVHVHNLHSRRLRPTAACA